MSAISSFLQKTSFSLKCPSLVQIPKMFESIWRFSDWGAPNRVWPNRRPHFEHHKHRRHAVKPFSEGVFKQTRMRVVDNSKLGKEASVIGRPPKVIHVYSKRHRKGPHGAYGKLGDIVKVAICGEVKKGIVVGMKAKQPHGIPKFDTNNLVLIEDDGTPCGNQISAPIPHQLKKILADKTHYKKPEYNKMLKNVKKWV